MRYPLMLSMISMTCIQAASPLKPEAPLIAQAEALYRSKTPLAPTGVDDILKLHLQGDAKFAFEAITGRWVVDSLASGKIPDECTLQRILSGFTWDEDGVRKLHEAGLDRSLLREMALARPLSLSEEARQRLAKAGVEPETVTALSGKPESSWPAMRTTGDLMMESVAGNPMLQIPALKVQLTNAMGKAERKLNERFQTEAFRKDIWARLLENWRSHIQVGSDPKAVLVPMATTITDGVPEDPERSMQGLMGGAQIGNDLFLRSAPVGVALGAGDVLAVLNARSVAVVRISRPNEMLSFRADEATEFWTRRKPSDLVLVRLQENGGSLTTRFTKGVLLGRAFRPAEEPLPIETHQDGNAWNVRPKSLLSPGSYAFLMGGENVEVIPFIVR